MRNTYPIFTNLKFHYYILILAHVLVLGLGTACNKVNNNVTQPDEDLVEAEEVGIEIEALTKPDAALATPSQVNTSIYDLPLGVIISNSFPYLSWEDASHFVMTCKQYRRIVTDQDYSTQSATALRINTINHYDSHQHFGWSDKQHFYPLPKILSPLVRVATNIPLYLGSFINIQEVKLHKSSVHGRGLNLKRNLEGLSNREKYKQIERVEIDSYIDNKMARLLTESLQGSTNLKKLTLSASELDDAGIEILAKLLVNKRPEVLATPQLPVEVQVPKLNNNNGDKLIEPLESLQELDLSHNKIGAEGIKHLAEVHNTSLQTLKLSYNKIGAEGIKYLVKILKNYTSLQTLDLEGTGIGEEDAKHIAEALKYNTSLKVLHLNANKIGAKGTKYIAEALETNISLQKLYLSYNDIGKEGAEHVAKALGKNKTLQVLYLTGNNIGNWGAKLLTGALKYNTSLKVLHLNANKIDSGYTKWLTEALKNIISNSSLQELDLSCNLMGNEGAKSIAEGLKNITSSSSLQELDLSCNLIGNEGGKSIAEALQNITSDSSLHKLDLSGNFISTKR